MNKCMLAVLCLSVFGCSPAREVVQVIKGDPGANGHSIVSQFDELSEESLECANGGTSLNLYIDMDDSLSASDGDVYTGSLVACNGANGLNGIDGARGLDGTPGRPGRDGRNGCDGRDGRPGATGPAGPAGPQGRPGATGPAGPIGATGSQGAQGAQGPAGPIGPQGPAGTPGAVGPSGGGATITVYSSSSCVSISGTSYYAKSGTIYSSSSCHSSSKVTEFNGGDDTLWVASSKLAVENGDDSLKVISFN